MASGVATEQETTLHRELGRIVGESFVLGGTPERRKSERRKGKRKNQKERKTFADQLSDYAIDGVIPSAVVSPADEKEVAAILRFAGENDYNVVPQGAGTKQSIGTTPQRVDILLRTHRMNEVLHYDAGDLTLSVEAGMTIAEVQGILAKNSQFLPLDPMLPERATIGGVLAANAHGPMRSGFGSVRDYCIGINFVTGDGKTAKGGGKVVKNVAGYDLMKLIIGSMGTLAVITSANFKVFPLPKQTRTFILDCSDLATAIAQRDRIIASPLAPMCMELVSPRAHEYLSAKSEVRDPDHYAPQQGMKRAEVYSLVVRAGGSDAVLNRYRKDLGEAVSRELAGAEEINVWQRLSNFEDSIRTRHFNCMVVNAGVAPSGVRAAYEAAEQSALEHNLLSASIGRAATGSLTFAFVPLGVDPPNAMQFANVASSLRSRLPKGSAAVVVHCPLEAKKRFDVWGSSANDMALMREVRAAMDPKNILNRGRFVV
jgi:glycolate oxidase FAD binding subunit